MQTSFRCSRDNWVELLQQLGPALSACPTLTNVNIRLSDYYHSEPSTTFADLLSHPTLQLTITYTSAYETYFDPRVMFTEYWADVDGANGRVRCTWRGDSYILGDDSLVSPLPLSMSNGDPNWVPMRLASRETRVNVWRQVVWLSLESEPDRTDWHSRVSWFKSYAYNLTTAQNTLIASRELYVRLIAAAIYPAELALSPCRMPPSAHCSPA